MATHYADARHKKYPLNNRKHVASAIRLFGMHADNYDPQLRRHIAKEIRKAAKEYGFNLHAPVYFE